ncbi:MAG: alpha/beta hydrolase [Sporichthyaceae bacterium]|nr:alpha/beta hydrolase [Sporichthyaceae bacterium]
MKRHLAVLASVVAVVAVGCTSSDRPAASEPTNAGTAVLGQVPEELRSFYTQEPRWAGCGGDYECAKVKVPLDYTKPEDETIELAVIRLAAGSNDERLGSLLINPGGPGASGVDYARSARAVLSENLLRHYDVVGFDPRGVGESAPVTCINDEQMDEFIAIDGSPNNAAEVEGLDDEAKEFAAGCEKNSGELLPYVSTADAARDMDVIRAVVGDEKLNYLGKSYGTFLGATYAGLFPQRVGRLVLDGAIDPRVSGEEMSLAQAEGFEQALRAFMDDCVQQSDCPVGPSTQEGLDQIGGLLDSVDQTPLPSSSGREVTQSLAILGIATALYDRTNGWPVLRDALSSAIDGDGSVLLFLADLYADRNESGHYNTNSMEAIYAVNCLDRPDHNSPADIQKNEAAFKKASPHFGDYLAWSNLPCRYWPTSAGDGPNAITADGAAPILVVGTTRDPATPYQWAVGLAEQLKSGVLVTYEGDGHTAYFQGDGCIDEIVDNYLIAGEVPEDGVKCG